MRVLGVDLHKPSFRSFTLAVLLGVSIWALAVLLGMGGTDTVEITASLVSTVIGCLCCACGINVLKGGNHVLLLIICSSAVFVVFQLCVSIFV